MLMNDEFPLTRELFDEYRKIGFIYDDEFFPEDNYNSWDFFEEDIDLYELNSELGYLGDCIQLREKCEDANLEKLVETVNPVFSGLKEKLSSCHICRIYAGRELKYLITDDWIFEYNEHGEEISSRTHNGLYPAIATAFKEIGESDDDTEIGCKVLLGFDRSLH